MSDTTSPDWRFPLLFGGRWNARGLAGVISAIDVDALAAEYRALKADAPMRSHTGKPYFGDRPGHAASRKESNRREELMAVEMLRRSAPCQWPGGGSVRLLDYQVPLKGRRGDQGVGKIDLLGVTDAGRLAVVELKVTPVAGGRGGSPMAALMEGLRYAAMVEADLDAIRQLAGERFGIIMSDALPCIAVLGEESWWERWDSLTVAGEWQQEMDALSAALEIRLGIEVTCLSVNGDVAASVRPGLAKTSQSAMASCAVMERPRELQSTYLTELNGQLWDWAEQHLAGLLTSARRPGSPPVLRKEASHLNVVVPDDAEAAVVIRALIPPHQRHTHFGSLRSSQALAQSVFGAIAVLNRQGFLARVRADCDRPAFENVNDSIFGDAHGPADSFLLLGRDLEQLRSQRRATLILFGQLVRYQNAHDQLIHSLFGAWTDGWSLELEHEVRTLGEHRPTSIDVLMQRDGYDIAVECKFTETGFGRCSRMQLKPTEADTARKHCNGSYTVQQGRRERCALTEIGIRYWDHLPELFGWARDVDHMPCTFGEIYQLARNAMAVARSGQAGHVVVVYDADNPAFRADGFARQQWDMAVAACRHPGLLRKLSWQSLLAAAVDDDVLAPVMAEIRAKYFIGE